MFSKLFRRDRSDAAATLPKVILNSPEEIQSKVDNELRAFVGQDAYDMGVGYGLKPYKVVSQVIGFRIDDEIFLVDLEVKEVDCPPEMRAELRQVGDRYEFSIGLSFLDLNIERHRCTIRMRGISGEGLHIIKSGITHGATGTANP